MRINGLSIELPEEFYLNEDFRAGYLKCLMDITSALKTQGASDGSNSPKGTRTLARLLIGAESR